MDAQAALEAAKDAEKAEGVRTRAASIKKLQTRRAKSLEEAETAFNRYIDKIVDSERSVVQMHQAAGGCRTVGDALNQRHGPMGAWMSSSGIVTLIEGGRNGLQHCPFGLPRSRNSTH